MSSEPVPDARVPPRRGARTLPLGLLLAGFSVMLVLGAAVGVSATAHFLLRSFLQEALPPEAIDRSLRAVFVSLLVATAAVVLLAAAAALAVSRSLTRPLLELADSARRIGGGDLATPVAEAPGEELGGLARTMEEMRRRLLEVTAELRRRDTEAQALLGGIVEGVLAVDEHRRIRYLNPQAAALLGVDPEAVKGSFCGDVLRPAPIGGERPCESRCPIVHARVRGSTRATEVLQLPRGARRTVVITSSPPFGGSQVQILRDETDVEGARRARDAIVANVSHEFRTPLSAQLASLELLRGRLAAVGEGSELDRDVAELVTSLGRSSLRLVQLVDNLLESVRLESGEGSIRRGPVFLDDVIEEAQELIVPLLRQRGQRIEVDLPHPLPSLEGDHERLVQLLVNLLANASKFSPEGTRIGIAVSGGVEASIRLTVEDEGPGLPENAEESIFDRFYRAGEPDPGGMGLGLWIVKSIAERHGGTVEGRSLPGRGSRFTLTLPSGQPVARDGTR